MKKSKGQTVDLLYTKKEETKKTKSVGATSSRMQKSRNNKKNKIAKYVILIFLIVGAITMFMMSSVFNIKQIIVSNNSKISSEEIISLSGLTIETNMFKTSNNSINNSIKANPYIESVKVKRKLNGIVVLEIQERTPTYMLQFGNSYVYINNQGYMLELSETPLELPVITGIETSVEEIKEGNRLVVNDLQKLEDIIKIMESAKSNSISNMISGIDISDKANYKLTIASENKIVQFGDATNINIKLLKIEEIIQQEKGISGEIYFQDSEKTVFREMVSF